MRTRLTDIVDGSSNTPFAGERPPSSDSNFGWWYAGRGQDDSGSVDMILGVREWNAQSFLLRRCPLGASSFVPGRMDRLCDALHFWSLHDGGGHFAFADGSVRFLSYAADAILPALATRSGAEAVELPN